MMQKSKEIWLRGGLHERAYLIMGVVVMLIFLAYMTLLKPLEESVQELKINVHNNYRALAHVKSISDQLQKSQAITVNGQTKDILELMTTTQATLKASLVNANVSQIKQNTDRSVSVKFDSVNFDHLTRWLIDYSSESQVMVAEVQIDAVEDQPAEVKAELVLRA